MVHTSTAAKPHQKGQTHLVRFWKPHQMGLTLLVRFTIERPNIYYANEEP